MFEYLHGKVQDVFSDKDASTLVYEPSIHVSRNSQRKDEFTYEVLFDLALRLKRSSAEGVPDGMFIVGNPTIHDLKCSATFVPSFSYG